MDGGIWLNTQRPEWNDANNALVGHGVSVVTLNYLRRYVYFLQNLLLSQKQEVELSVEVASWLQNTAQILADLIPKLNNEPVTDELRFEVLAGLGKVACQYRASVYKNESFSHKVMVILPLVQDLLTDALTVIDHSIKNNLTNDGLFHSYNLLALDNDKAVIKNLYPMLEGQVAALSSSAIGPEKAIDVIEALYASDIFRPDLNTFMLYPDKDQIGFLAKNIIPLEQISHITVLVDMLKNNEHSIVTQDCNGLYRFNANLKNSSDLIAQLETLATDYPELSKSTNSQIERLYEQVFQHQAFTGRSGGMFGFEGLGCVYWHMVSKLLLVVQEHFMQALNENAQPELVNRLGDLYYRVRQGIGFNKTPEEYGAFPCDPYSHTPKHAGAQQPGMTGQVKEEILTRFGELGIQVEQGSVCFNPRLLRKQEFTESARNFKYLDVTDQWQEIALPANSLAFTWCQVPVVYSLTDSSLTENNANFIVELQEGGQIENQSNYLDSLLSQQLFMRSGKIKLIRVSINSYCLFGHENR